MRALFVLAGLAACALLALGALLREPPAGGRLEGPGAAPALAPGAAEPARAADGSIPAPELAARAAARAALAPAPAPVEGPERRFAGLVRRRGGGAPLEGARVLVTGGGLELSAQTDALGAFELAVGALEEAAVEVSHPAHAPARRPRVALVEPALFELDPAATIAGRVLGPAPADVRVLVWSLASGARGEAPRQLALGADSAFELPGLPAGEYTVAALAPGFAPASESRLLLEPGARRELRLELSVCGLLRGVVRRGEGGPPVEGARLRLWPERQGQARDIEELGEVELLTGPDGTFALEALAPGASRLEVRAPWGAEVQLRLEAPEGGLLERDVVLPQAAGLTGRVLGPDGRPAAGAWVLASWERRELDFPALAEEDAELPGDARRTRADASGRFELPELPPRRALRLLASADRHAPDAARGWSATLELRPGERRAGVELALVESAALVGELRSSAGAPLERARVRASLRVDGRARAGAETRSDAEGRFALRGLPPGALVISARIEGFADATRELELAPGAEAALALELAPAPRLSGVVLDDEGYAVPHARVRALPRDARGDEDGSRRERSDQADGYGRFLVDELEPGRYALAASARGYSARGPAPTVELPAEGALELRLERDPPPARAVLSGEARMASGAAPRGLRFEGTRGGAVELDGGRFRISGVAPGRVVLRVRADGAAEERLAPIELAPGRELDLGLVRLSPGAEVRVDVREVGGERLSGARVRLVPLRPDQGGPPAGTGSVTLRARRDGRYEAQGVRLGAWQLRVDRAGYAGERRRMAIERGGSSARVELALRAGGDR